MSEPDGFFSRWSRRKAQVRERREEPAPEPALPAAAVVVSVAETREEPPATAPAEPPPTLEDAAALTPASDFARFVARDVDPAVKNTALKKLFADPHFNVMDGLDIYIDDYGKPDPLPAGMLRQLAQSQFLGLFDDERDDERDDAKKTEAAPETVPPAPTLEAPPDEDADLRLQSHDAADAAEPGAGEPGAGEDAAGER